MLIENNEPTTYEDAIAGRDSTKWQEVMQTKMDSMYINQVWTLVNLLNG